MSTDLEARPGVGGVPGPRVGGPGEAPAQTPVSTLAKRRRWVIAVVACCLVVGVVGFQAGRGMTSPAQLAAEAEPPPPDLLTAAVDLRELTSSVVIRGQVIAGQSVTVTDVGPGSSSGRAPVVTALRTEEGKRVTAGDVPVEISGRPVFVLPGSLPAYRDLKPTDRGPDVTQLQEALESVGYSTSGDRAGVFGEATADALSDLYEDRGYDPVPALADGEAQLEAAEDAVAAAKETVAAAEGGQAKSTAREKLGEAKRDREEVAGQVGASLPASEVVFLGSFPATVTDLGVRRGSQVEGPIMTLSSGQFVVQGHVAVDQKPLVGRGQGARIREETSGFDRPGRVTGIGARQATSGNGDQARPIGFPVTITAKKPLPTRLLNRNVRITLQTATTGEKVLAVPVAAISTAADAGTVVTVVKPGTGQRRRVEVTVGATADGYAEIQPRGELSAGDQVVTGVARGIA